MSNVQKVSVALTPEIIAMLKAAVETGEYHLDQRSGARRPAHMEIATNGARNGRGGVAAALERRRRQRNSAEGELVFSRLRKKYAKQALTE